MEAATAAAGEAGPSDSSSERMRLALPLLSTTSSSTSSAVRRERVLLPQPRAAEKLVTAWPRADVRRAMRGGAWGTIEMAV